jgi:hypothetical protein
MASPDDIILWPDGGWIYREEAGGREPAEAMSRSDDYEVIPVDSERWKRFTAHMLDDVRAVEISEELEFDYCTPLLDLP